MKYNEATVQSLFFSVHDHRYAVLVLTCVHMRINSLCSYPNIFFLCKVGQWNNKAFHLALFKIRTLLTQRFFSFLSLSLFICFFFFFWFVLIISTTMFGISWDKMHLFIYSFHGGEKMDVNSEFREKNVNNNNNNMYKIN